LAHVLLAIKPRFADLIVSGRKVIEVRRGGTSIRIGDVLVLYKSSPDRTVCATCSVASVETLSVRVAMSTLNGNTGLSKQELAAYLRGAGKVTLLGLESVLCLSRPIPLKQLRRLKKNIVIPQSYRFLRPTEVQQLSKHLDA